MFTRSHYLVATKFGVYFNVIRDSTYILKMYKKPDMI